MYQLHGTIEALRENVGRTPARDRRAGDGAREWSQVTERVEGEPACLGELVARLPRARGAARPALPAAARGVAGDGRALRAPTPTSFQVRDKVIEQDLHSKSLSHLRDPEGGAAALRGLGRPPDLAADARTRPGHFPFTAGVFPLKREGEDPARMFAGEGGPERTNRRFHYVSRGLPAKRLSTAFDSVTLYGEDPDAPPGHLRQGRQLRRLDRHRRRRQEALLAASTSPTRRPRCR